MENIISLAVLVIVILVPIYLYTRWQSKKDVDTVINRIETIRTLLIEAGFTEYTDQDIELTRYLKKNRSTIAAYTYTPKGNRIGKPSSISCLITGNHEDKLDILFSGFSKNGLQGSIIGQISFQELRLRRKNPWLCISEGMLEEVINYFKELNQQFTENDHPQFHRIYAPIRQPLKDEINNAKPSKFSLLYSWLFFISIYGLLGISGISLPNVLIALVSLSVVYAFLVWRYPYLQVEEFKREKLGWKIASGVFIIAVGLIFSPHFYPIEWANISIAMFFFFTFILATAHAMAQLALQHLFLR